MTQPPSFPPPPPPGPSSASETAYPAAPPYAHAPHPGDPWDGGPAPAVPRTVSAAFALMLTRSALSLVGLVVTFATRDQLVERVRRQQLVQSQRTGVDSPLDPQSVVDVGIVVGVVFGLAFLVFYVFLAFKVRRGRQWARVVTWVLAGIGVVGLLTQFVVSAAGVTRAVGIATGLLDIAIIVVLALAPTSRFVAATAARRHR